MRNGRVYWPKVFTAVLSADLYVLAYFARRTCKAIEIDANIKAVSSRRHGTGPTKIHSDLAVRRTRQDAGLVRVAVPSPIYLG